MADILGPVFWKKELSKEEKIRFIRQLLHDAFRSKLDDELRPNKEADSTSK